MRRDGLQFKHIEVFRAVIAGGSASEAARLLGLSQPAVSKIIAQAELHAGISLFERRQGRLVPTPLALTLYSETNVLFSTLENIDRIVARVIKSEIQPIAFGAVPLLATTLLPRVLPDWRARSGRVLSLYTYDAPSLLSLLAAQRLEFAITVVMQHMQGLASSQIIRSPVYCALPRDHRLAGKPVIHACDLDGESYIGLSRHEGIQSGIDRVFIAENVRPDEVMQVPLMAAAVRMAEEGAGIALVDLFGMHVARSDRLVFRRFEPAVHFEYCAVWPENRDADFDRTQLIAILRRSARQMLEQAEGMVGIARNEPDLQTVSQGQEHA